MNYNIKSLLFLFSFLIGSAAFGQPDNKMTKEERQERHELIQAQKVAFISNQLELTTGEAEKFWPVFNEYEAEIEKVRRAHRIEMKKLRDIDNLSEDEAYSITEKILNLEEQNSKIRKEYLAKFAEVLGKKKAAKVYIAEEKFKRELLKKIKKGNHGPHDGPPPPPY
jgi:Spy/CpxP family protein refolding chaperone